MCNLRIIFAVLFLFTINYLSIDAQTYSDDSLIVAELLSANGYTSTPVSAISYGENGRITTISIPPNDIQIRVLPQSIGALSALSYMNLSDNIIHELPSTFSQLQNLTMLYLIRNRLTSWPDVFYKMPNLTSIDIGGNHLTRLPDSISVCNNLKSLYINDNYLNQLPESIVNLNLENVNVAGNSLQNLSEALIRWLDQKDLDKEGSKWKDYQYGFCGIDTIYIHDILDEKGLTDIPVDSITVRINGCVTDVDLSYARLSAFAAPRIVTRGITLPDRFTYFRNLRSINLAGHQLDILPQWFGNMCHLTNLDLSGNNFTTLPDFMVAFKNLVTLNLSGNQIRSLSPEVKAWADKFDAGWSERQATTNISVNQITNKKCVPKISAMRSSDGQTSISIFFSRAEKAELSAYAFSGRKITTIARKQFNQGKHIFNVKKTTATERYIFDYFKKRCRCSFIG